MKNKKLTGWVVVIVFILLLSGCATVPYTPPSVPSRIGGIYHEVEKGETLWKIAKAYDVDIKEIAKVNRLPDASQINAGQLIFVPYAKKRLGVSETHAKGDSFIWPVEGKVISFFGALKNGVKNQGIDIAAKEGTDVVASRSGKIGFSDERVKGLGKTVIVDHGDGYSTVYAHNANLLVKVGDCVRQGAVIAKAGKTGRAETACLHFEIRRHHQPENPFYYLP